MKSLVEVKKTNCPHCKKPTTKTPGGVEYCSHCIRFLCPQCRGYLERELIGDSVKCTQCKSFVSEEALIFEICFIS